MAETADLSDKAVAVFAFAAYHQLTSGQPVKSVIREDGKGHKADDEAVQELTAKDLVEVSGNDICFSEAGLHVLSTAIEGLKSAARSA
jgi:chromosome segregation and condensation protein ScpB